MTLCFFAWCQAMQETEFFVEDWGDYAGLVINKLSLLLEETQKERQCPCGKEIDEGSHHVQYRAKHSRGAWLFGHTDAQGVWKKAGESGRRLAPPRESM